MIGDWTVAQAISNLAFGCTHLAVCYIFKQCLAAVWIWWKKILMSQLLWSSWVRDKNHKDIAYNLETKEVSHAIGASELAVYWVEVVELLVEDREGTKHARIASELVVCSPVFVVSFAARSRRRSLKKGRL